MAVLPSTGLCRSTGVRIARILFASLLFGYDVMSLQTNRTIDDQFGDSVTGVLPEYSPPALWDKGITCANCTVHLDPSRVLYGSWHDTTHRPGEPDQHSITMRFNGTAVYVYNIVANTIPDNPNVVHGSNMTFSIDGALVGTFVHIPSSSTAYEYNYTVFSSTNLPNTEHTVVVQTTGDSVSSLILFDYAIYTFDDESEVASPSPISPSSSSTSTEVRLAHIIATYNLYADCLLTRH